MSEAWCLVVVELRARGDESGAVICRGTCAIALVSQAGWRPATLGLRRLGAAPLGRRDGRGRGPAEESGGRGAPCFIAKHYK
eukprot:scaffold64461_cov35-Tisochrysis_lutea.AAC.6